MGFDQQDDNHDDHQFVRDRVEESAKRRFQLHRAREVTVDPVADAGDEKDDLATARPDEDPQLLLDGTANLDYADEDAVPRVRGLIELVEEFLGSRD